MPAFEALTVVVVVAFLALIALVVVVTAGIHEEEREHSLLRKTPPGPAALVARRVLGLYVKKTEPEATAGGKPEQPVPWYERSI